MKILSFFTRSKIVVVVKRSGSSQKGEVKFRGFVYRRSPQALKPLCCTAIKIKRPRNPKADGSRYTASLSTLSWFIDTSPIVCQSRCSWSSDDNHEEISTRIDTKLPSILIYYHRNSLLSAHPPLLASAATQASSCIEKPGAKQK